VLYAARHFRLRRGYLFPIYTGLYCVGRFVTEYLRVDDAHRFYGLRLNDWTCIIVFTVSVVVLAVRARPRPGDDLAMAPLSPPAGSAPTPDPDIDPVSPDEALSDEQADGESADAQTDGERAGADATDADPGQAAQLP
jgi:hypothetical protein